MKPEPLKGKRRGCSICSGDEMRHNVHYDEEDVRAAVEYAFMRLKQECNGEPHWCNIAEHIIKEAFVDVVEKERVE